MIQGMKLDNIDKIAVLRANGIGDWVFSLPALDALRATYPQAEIVLLGLPWHAEFLGGRPSPVDRVVVVPRSRGIRDEAQPQEPGELVAFLTAMRAEHFDLAIQLHGGGTNSNPFIRQLGARVTVGLKTPDAEPLDAWVPYIYFQSEIMRCLEVVSLVGARTSALEPQFMVTQDDRDEARAVVPETTQPLVALHPGAGDGRRRWPPEKFAAVGDALAAVGARVVVTGKSPEGQIVGAVLAAMRSPGQNLCDRLSLGGTMAVLSRCKVVVSNDSGPLHLAGAVGTATVGIYWCANLINAGPVTRTRHRPLLSWRLDCPICGRNIIDDNCSHHDSFVADVSTEKVIGATLGLFQNR